MVEAPEAAPGEDFDFGLASIDLEELLGLAAEEATVTAPAGEEEEGVKAEGGVPEGPVS